VQIVRGLPGQELMEQAERGEVILAGCIVGMNDPTWGCLECGSEWGQSRKPEPSEIRNKFSEYFKRWDINLPRGAVASARRGLIYKAGWTIRYLFGKDAGETYIEFYAIHRMTDDTRRRIYESGRVEDLATIEPRYIYDAKVPGDEERAKREHREHNDRVAEELRELGLYPEGDINTYLRTHDVPRP
jgi:hypothetical protein